MRLSTRNLLDRSFTLVGILAVAVMTAALLVILVPIFRRGAGAFAFTATVEHRRMTLEQFGRGDPDAIRAETQAAAAARAPVYEMMTRFETELDAAPAAVRRKLRGPYKDIRERLATWIGPAPTEPIPILPRDRYGQTRWDRAQIKLRDVLFEEVWDYDTADGWGRKTLRPRADAFRGTALEPLFPYVERHARDMLRPRRAFYWRFLFDGSVDSHFFGGVWPELLGTIYLTIGAMLFAVPMGLISAIYLSEYARDGRVVALLRTCISTLAGVPSIVFGLFGLAFFIHTLGVSDSKSVLAGSLSLAILVLPTVIRASEEAIRSVPRTYREAALSLGAGKWRTIMTVILPAALPGVLTGTVISMGRAAGETAPIIFTAAVSVGMALKPWEVWNQPTPALSWNVYNLATEHVAVEELRHVQFGMVFTLVALVLLLNVTAIIMRAAVSKKLRA